MHSKMVKNEQWYVKTLIERIDNNDILKPKYQRRKKWDILQKKENNPNEKSYILFLYEVKNSVHAITFGQSHDSKKYMNIDGNNRINALKHFIDKPFDLFPEILDNLVDYIRHSDKINHEDKQTLENLFFSISYHDIIEMSFQKYFMTHSRALYISTLKYERDEFEELLDKIQFRLKVGGKDRFDTNVLINVNLFEGYTTDELCKIFEDINKFSSALTESELLACKLYNLTGFQIHDNVLEKAIVNEIIGYYKNKCIDEVLQCFHFDHHFVMNGYDFIVGFQNYCHVKFDIIEKSDSMVGLSLFFKIYKILYGGYTHFTSENVNDFMHNILFAIETLQKVYAHLFTSQINNKLFNKSCDKKVSHLKTNNIVILILAIIGFKRSISCDNKMINSITKCILYHFFMSGVKNKEQRDLLKTNDILAYEPCGSHIENLGKLVLQNPESISDRITKPIITEIIYIILKDELKEKRKEPNDKRKERKFMEKILLFEYFKAKVPTNLLNNTFSIEHIFPFSSTWGEEIDIDIDRLGNIVPIVNEINLKRQNKHILAYEKIDTPFDFIKFIDVIPSHDEYNNIISHEFKSPLIKYPHLYNDICERNEKIYVDTLINSLSF